MFLQGPQFADSVDDDGDDFLYADPDDADDDVHALALSAVVLKAPHAVRLLVPECLCCRVHASSTDVWFAVRSSRATAIACADEWAVGFGFASAFWFV